MNDQDDTLGTRRAAARRSQGQIVVARALWYVKAGVAELRTERLNPPRGDEVRVATRYSALSRGTERLVSLGEVPQSEWSRMRAPMQSGDFPFPVKYGYSATGIVTTGAEALIGQRVFALHPHQDHFQVSASAVVPLADTISDKRATLAANMETALNAHWDAGTAPGDKILVVGAGVLGLLTAYLARRIAGADVTLTDIEGSRAPLAASLGIPFVPLRDVRDDNQIVFHTSATGAGLQTALDGAGFEGRIIDLSWYGTRPISINLGGAYHSRRLQLISSQVGHVSPRQRATTSHRARLIKAISLLDDPVLDVLVSAEIGFDDLALALPRIWMGADASLPPVIRYRADERTMP